MKYKSLEELRAAFPDEPMDDLAEIAKETGLDTTLPQDEESGEENSETPAEETAEEEAETPEEDEEEADPKTKYALIQARKKEKDKRKAAEAELKAKTEEYERRIAELSARPQQQPYQAPAVEQAVQPSYYDILMDEADILARKEAGIDRGITDDELSTMQFTEPKRYQKYILAKNIIATEKHQENVAKAKVFQENQAVIQEFNAHPQGQAIYAFADSLLDDMPRRDARKIDEALTAISNNSANKEQIDVLRKHFKDAEARFMEAKGVQQKQMPVNAPQMPQGASKLDRLADTSRTQELRRGGARAMTESDLDRMFEEDPLRAIQNAPAALLDRIRRS